MLFVFLSHCDYDYDFIYFATTLRVSFSLLYNWNEQEV